MADLQTRLQAQEILMQTVLATLIRSEPALADHLEAALAFFREGETAKASRATAPNLPSTEAFELAMQRIRSAVPPTGM